MKQTLLLFFTLTLISCGDMSTNQSSSAREEDSLTVTPAAEKVAAAAPKPKYDPTQIASLKKLMIFKKDEFEGKTWVQPKDQPAYRNSNGMYCYFETTENQIGNFRFVIQYFAEDWLFIQKYDFVIDGKAYSFTPLHVDTDNGDGDIWEWCDEHIEGEDGNLIEALANAKTAKIRFEGRQYYHDRTIPAKQLKSIKNVLTLYKAMGGRL
jgi:hypothetical protein